MLDKKAHAVNIMYDNGVLNWLFDGTFSKFFQKNYKKGENVGTEKNRSAKNWKS